MTTEKPTDQPTDATRNNDAILGWFRGRLPEDWLDRPVEITHDKDEITVWLSVDDPEFAGDDSEDLRSATRAGRSSSFREDTRPARMKIATEAEHRFSRKVSWGLQVGEDHRELWTHLAVPMMTRLRQPERLVLDTLVEAGVARSRADALGWCVRLVAQHEEDWLAELRSAMTQVREVRRRGPGS